MRYSHTHLTISETASVAPESVLVPLTKGRVASIDSCDAERVLARPWYSTGNSRRRGYAASRIDGVIILLHRFILMTPPGFEVDHINRDGLDCRRCNLRVATHSQNMANAPRVTLPSSGFRGVSRSYRKTKPWMVRITVGYQEIYGGLFADAAEAARAYDKLARTYFGEFATLNFPGEAANV